MTLDTKDYALLASIRPSNAAVDSYTTCIPVHTSSSAASLSVVSINKCDPGKTGGLRGPCPLDFALSASSMAQLTKSTEVDKKALDLFIAGDMTDPKVRREWFDEILVLNLCS